MEGIGQLGNADLSTVRLLCGMLSLSSTPFPVVRCLLGSDPVSEGSPNDPRNGGLASAQLHEGRSCAGSYFAVRAPRVRFPELFGGKVPTRSKDGFGSNLDKAFPIP